MKRTGERGQLLSVGFPTAALTRPLRLEHGYCRETGCAILAPVVSELLLSVALVTRNSPSNPSGACEPADSPEDVVVSGDSDEAFAPLTREVA